MAPAARRLAACAATLACCLDSPAGALVAEPEPLVCNEFAAADAVFVADVLDHQVIGDPDEETVERYRVRVRESFKGDLRGTVTIWTPNTSGRGILEPGLRHVIFAWRRDGRLWIRSGGNTQPEPFADAVVGELRQHLARPPSAATIRGRVMTYAGRVRFLKQARSVGVTLVGPGGERVELRADPDGWFLAEVSPGRWRAQVSEPGWTSRPWDLSYDDPSRIELAPSGCADVQLLATPTDEPAYDNPIDLTKGSGGRPLSSARDSVGEAPSAASERPDHWWRVFSAAILALAAAAAGYLLGRRTAGRNRGA